MHKQHTQHLMSSGSHMLIVHSTQHGTPTDKAHPQVQYNQVQSQPPPPLGAMYYAIQETPVVGLITLEDVLEELMQVCWEGGCIWVWLGVCVCVCIPTITQTHPHPSISTHHHIRTSTLG